MKLLFLIVGIALTLSYPSKGGEDWFWARITYYTDKQTASGVKPVQGDTVAAERAFKFGTRFHIPDLKKISKDGKGVFTTSDRGPAVEKRIASKGKYPVIDIYVSNHSKIREYSRSFPSVVKVTVK